MAITPKRLVTPTQLGTTISTLYTATNVRTLIDKVTLVNTSGGAVTADVHIVPSGGSATATNKLIAARSVAANETYTCPELVGHVMEASETIQALASAATAIGIRASGREVSST